MIAVYQLLHGGINIDREMFIMSAADGPTRGHVWKLKKPRAKTRSRRCALEVRIMNDWNALLASVIAAKMLNDFKSRLDSHWSHFHYTVHMND